MELRPTRLTVYGKRVWLEDDTEDKVRKKLEYDVLEASRPAMLVKKELKDDEVVIVD